MIKKLLTITGLILLAASASTRGFAALTANMLFVMPTGVDPVDLTFSFSGQTLTFFGSDTMPDPENPLDPFGVEFRSSGPLFNKFVITKDNPEVFSGALSVLTSADNINGTPTPWGVANSGAVTTLFAVPGSALVGEPNNNPIEIPLHSILQFQSLTDGTELDQEAFAGQRYKVTAFAVPEPGTWSIGACLAISALGVVRLKRRK
jgi:hypothetical protein